ncbi:biotin--protein ligase isoform X2 [Antennarius striatus]|uniref:biotin--protein ligase isoform X2 n=1 Tax=Antennarius striatus TaxID=241820 RepID=UPI0035B0CCBC
MLITVCYVYLWVRFHRCYSSLIRSGLSRLQSSSFSFRLCSGPGPGGAAPPAGARRSSAVPPEDVVFLQLGDKAVCITQPQAFDDLSQWTALLGPCGVWGPQREKISFIIEAAGQPEDSRCPHASRQEVLKWTDCCLPVARGPRGPGLPFRAVAQATVDDFSQLGVAFMEGRLQLDNGLMPSEIVPVLLRGSTLSDFLQQHQQTSVLGRCSQMEEPPPCRLGAERHQGRKGSLFLSPDVQRRLEDRRGSEPLCTPSSLGPVSDPEDHLVGTAHQGEGHGHPLHLSSCNECLELENSTILSVKYASVENIPDLPDDGAGGLEAGGGPLDDIDRDAQSDGLAWQSKPPNVLVFTGGRQERFRTVCQLLSECLDMENYLIYPLLPQQVLTDPWLDNTRLLVLAEEEPLTPQIQTCFLTYLSRGGRVLGLSSSLCPAGLCLEARGGRRGQVSRLLFTREDSTEVELSLLASGRVYIRDSPGGGEVELWGELKGGAPHQRDMVIVRLTHEGDGGEAVLCQVHLETGPDSQNLPPEAFDELKVSNALRYEVLAEILTSLGLSCESNASPDPSTVHLLATSQEARSSCLRWLSSRGDHNGLLRLSRTSLQMVSCSGLGESPVVPGGCLTLWTSCPLSQSWTHFSMETYTENLSSSLLGHALLYAEVVTSTMDLLEGLTPHVPKDVGLIAVASRQIQGRGRGRNAWLSPVGCAMFTLSIQVEVSSRLGQRIPFLQHLAALAVVEAVRTLPGYQDIDLRVKWPNDIYYSNLMKLGGVLVTSTVIGPTFHLLAVAST